ncbi:MAG: hypothetical protein AAGD86_13375 [Pseudomonadota bacterium]
MFQLKLFADGFRDLLLSPVSFIAALTDMVTGNHGPKSNFYSVLRAGKKTDRWIDLFGAAERLEPGADASELDKLLDRFEDEVATSYREGRLSETAKDALQRAADALGSTDGLGAGWNTADKRPGESKDKRKDTDKGDAAGEAPTRDATAQDSADKP